MDEGHHHGALGGAADVVASMQAVAAVFPPAQDSWPVLAKAPWVDVVFGTHNVGALPVLLERARIARLRDGIDELNAEGRERLVAAFDIINDNFKSLFEALFDVQCFDLKAVESIGRNQRHVEMTAGTYANPFNCGAVVNRLDCAILSATEIDVNFNVNVNTESMGYLLHNTGGHCDVAAGAKVSIVVCPSIRGRLPMIRDEVTTITTPGETVGVIVTERGVAVNDKLPELKAELIRRRVPVKDIRQLRDEIYAVTGVPKPIEFEDDVVGLIEYRDGSIIDVVRKVRQ